jgi:hypothetical protein
MRVGVFSTSIHGRSLRPKAKGVRKVPRETFFKGKWYLTEKFGSRVARFNILLIPVSIPPFFRLPPRLIR